MRSRLALGLLLLATSFPAILTAQSPNTTIASKTAGMKRIDGLLPLTWDSKAGKLYLEIPNLDAARVVVG